MFAPLRKWRGYLIGNGYIMWAESTDTTDAYRELADLAEDGDEEAQDYLRTMPHTPQERKVLLRRTGVQVFAGTHEIIIHSDVPLEQLTTSSFLVRRLLSWLAQQRLTKPNCTVRQGLRK
jgi:hypothetical protein